MKHKFNYFYKITNLINGHFYYGIHSTDNLEDGYMGSGTRLKIAYEKYGMENFTKEILKFFDSRKEASVYEAEMVNENLITDDNCYNIIKGGEDFDLNGMVSVYDNEDKRFTFVTKEKYYNNKDTKYTTPSTGKVSVIIKQTKKTAQVSQVEFLENKDKYQAIANGKITVKDKNNNFYQVSVDDERYKNGDLVYVWKNRKHNENTIKKLKETLKNINHQKGEKNSHFNTCWITKNGINKNIKNEDFDKYASEGWIKGRKLKDKKYTQKDIENIKTLRVEKHTWSEIQNILNIPKTSLRDIRIKYNIQ